MSAPANTPNTPVPAETVIASPPASAGASLSLVPPDVSKITTSSVEAPNPVPEATGAVKPAADTAIDTAASEGAKDNKVLGDISKAFDELSADKGSTLTIAKPAAVKPATDASTTAAADKTAVDKGRDYSGVDEKVVPLLNRMSNEAFNYFKPLYIEHEKLKQASVAKDTEIKALREKHIPDSYYQHPDAYRLSPEYQQLDSAVQGFNQVKQHYMNQLTNIRSGKDVVDLSINEKGEFVFGTPRKPTVNDESQFTDTVSQAGHQLMNMQGQLQQQRATFNARHTEDVNWVKGAEDKYFKDYGDDKTDNGKAVRVIYDKLPASVKQHPIAMLAAKSFVANVQSQATIQALIARIKQLESGKVAVATAQMQAGPTVDGTVNSGAKPANNVTYDDFMKLKTE